MKLPRTQVLHVYTDIVIYPVLFLVVILKKLNSCHGQLDAPNICRKIQIQECQRKTRGISGIFGGPQLVCFVPYVKSAAPCWTPTALMSLAFHFGNSAL